MTDSTTSDSTRQRTDDHRSSDDNTSDYQRRALEGLTGVPAVDGNEITILRNGDEIFPAMLEAIEGAGKTIDFLTFVYWAGDIGRRFAEAFIDAAERGVRARILLDSIGARLIDNELVDRMDEAGCDVRWFRPVEVGNLGEANHRTHRKIMIVDENISFTGGVGIADEWSGDARDENEWRDTHFRIVGPATDGLRAAFVDNWAETGATIFDPGIDRFPRQPSNGPLPVQVVSGAAETGWSDISTLFRVLITLAEKRLRITTAYFNPDEHLVEVLSDAAKRGVEVEVLLPGPHADKRFAQLSSENAYEDLLEAGVRIWNFQPSMLHAKILTVDGHISSVGSSNMNHRSILHDEEVNLVVFDADFAAELDAHFDEDLERSVEIIAERWAERGPAQKAKEAVIDKVKDVL